MKKQTYVIELTRKVVETYEVSIEATCKEDAMEKAEELGHGDDLEWEYIGEYIGATLQSVT